MTCYSYFIIYVISLWRFFVYHNISQMLAFLNHRQINNERTITILLLLNEQMTKKCGWACYYQKVSPQIIGEQKPKKASSSLRFCNSAKLLINWFAQKDTFFFNVSFKQTNCLLEHWAETVYPGTSNWW